LKFDILEEIEKRIPGFQSCFTAPLRFRLSMLIQSIIWWCNESRVGIPEDNYVGLQNRLYAKINIDSDGRLAMTAAIRKVLAENPSEFDPRKLPRPSRDALKALYKHKNENVLGSAGKA
jgi:fructose-bisphosphate aldolase class II